jgi:hypothetical protein
LIIEIVRESPVMSVVLSKASRMVSAIASAAAGPLPVGYNTSIRYVTSYLCDGLKPLTAGCLEIGISWTATKGVPVVGA